MGWRQKSEAGEKYETMLEIRSGKWDLGTMKMQRDSTKYASVRAMLDEAIARREVGLMAAKLKENLKQYDDDH